MCSALRLIPHHVPVNITLSLLQTRLEKWMMMTEWNLKVNYHLLVANFPQ